MEDLYAMAAMLSIAGTKLQRRLSNLKDNQPKVSKKQRKLKKSKRRQSKQSKRK